MFLQYGSVVLGVIDLTRFERETVWTPDGADLLSVKHTLGVTATYAPGGYPRLPSAEVLSQDTKALLGKGDSDTTADVIRARPQGRPPGFAKAVLAEPVLETTRGGDGRVSPEFLHSGPETDAELRGRLWLPRQRLILWAYARDTGAKIKWLESPRPGFVTDVANGPKPLSVDVVSAAGEPESVVVHFQVQTEMSACPVGSDRLVLAHRWTMAHGHDENNYLTRTITGEITFNSAVATLPRASLRPDFVRAQFIHPIPLGFERKAPLIVQSSDGLTIRYTVTDTDPTIVFDPGDSGATKIQILERMAQNVERGFPGARWED